MFFCLVAKSYFSKNKKPCLIGQVPLNTRLTNTRPPGQLEEMRKSGVTRFEMKGECVQLWKYGTWIHDFLLQSWSISCSYWMEILKS